MVQIDTNTKRENELLMMLMEKNAIIERLATENHVLRKKVEEQGVELVAVKKNDPA